MIKRNSGEVSGIGLLGSCAKSYSQIYTYIGIYVHIYIYVHLYVCVHMYVCMHVCMHVCMYVCTYVCAYMYLHMHVSYTALQTSDTTDGLDCRRLRTANQKSACVRLRRWSTQGSHVMSMQSKYHPHIIPI